MEVSYMEVILIIIVLAIVLAGIFFMYFTSVNSGAKKFERWIEKILDDDKSDDTLNGK